MQSIRSLNIHQMRVLFCNYINLNKTLIPKLYKLLYDLHVIQYYVHQGD